MPRPRFALRRLSLIVLVAGLLLLVPAGIPRAPSPPDKMPSPEGGAAIPLAFETNIGQSAADVAFLAHTAGGAFFFRPTEVVLALPARPTDPAPRPAAMSYARTAAPPVPPVSLVHLQFLSAQAAPPRPEGAPLASRVNYLRGRDPQSWYTDVPVYRAITYQNLYPGVDLTYTGTDGSLKGTYTLAPETDPGLIRWRYAGVTALRIDGAGNLQLTPAGAPGGPAVSLQEQAPVAWQIIGGRRVPVAVHYRLTADQTLGFTLGPYDRTRSLTIDPDLVYATYLGGTGWDDGRGVAVDGAGNVYVAGATLSADFPVTGAYQGTAGGNGDVFVTKFNPTGTEVLYATYLGGSARDSGLALAVDPAGAAYVTGYTDSANFPLAGALQAQQGGGHDAFLAKLSPAGNALLYATYLGGTGDEMGFGIGLDRQGAVYVTGLTGSAGFPQAHPIQPCKAGDEDAFILKFDLPGHTLIYGTCLGGINIDQGEAIAVDAAGNAYVTGYTYSAHFPVVNPYQPWSGGGLYDAFLTKVNATGTAWLYSTYLGGGAADAGHAIALDAAGNIYVAGGTSSSDFPLQNPIQSAQRGNWDAFITELDPTGSRLRFSTLLGGNGANVEQAHALVVDGAGTIYVAGTTDSDNFPLRTPTQSQFGGGVQDAFVAQLRLPGPTLAFASYAGGAGDDYAWGLAVTAEGRAYVIGDTTSANFPVQRAWQPALAGGGDAFVTALELGPPGPPLPSPTPCASCATPTPVPVCTLTFNDVPAGSPFYDFISCLTCHGIVGGYSDGTFRPGAAVTRGQLAKFVSNAAGYQDAIPATQQTFADVPPAHPFWLYIERVAAHGVVSGYSDGTFRPEQSVTRGQVAKFVSNAAGYSDAIPATQQTFTDVPPADPFWLFIERVAEHGVVSGYSDGSFHPGASVTRGQTAKFISNAFFPGCAQP